VYGLVEIVNVAEELERWILDNKQRFSGRFKVVRVNDWSQWQHHGIALDLESDRISGRVTVWAKHLGTAGWPLADAEAIDGPTGEQLFAWCLKPFSDDLLSRWLAALEAH
jgi:hypothetical protein